MVIKEEKDAFINGIPADVRTRLEKAAEQSEMKITQLTSALYKGYIAAQNIEDENERYHQALEIVLAQLGSDQIYKPHTLDLDADPISADDIENEQMKINEFDGSGLPKFNFVNLFMDCLNLENIDPAMNYQNAMCTLNAINLGRVQAYTQNIYGTPFPKPLKTNTFSLIVATSGEGKSISHDMARSLVSSVMGQSVFAEKSAPETLEKSLARKRIATHVERTKTKDEDTGEEIVTEMIVELEQKMPESKLPRWWKVFWHSEFGGTLANMSKSYMSGMKEDWCEYYSGSDHIKGTAGDKRGDHMRYIIENPFFGVNGTTTDEGATNLTTADVGSGLIPRFEDVLVTRRAPLPELTEVLDDSENNAAAIMERIDAQKKDKEKSAEMKNAAMKNAAQIINILLGFDETFGIDDDYEYDRDGIIYAEFDQEALHLIQNHEITLRKHFANDSTTTLLRSRAMENLYKDCILLAIGNLPYYVMKLKIFDGKVRLCEDIEDIDSLDNLWKQLYDFKLETLANIRLNKLIITAQIVRFAMKMHDRIYFPSKIAIVNRIMATSTENKNDMMKTIEVCEHSPRITKAELVEEYIRMVNLFERFVQWKNLNPDTRPKLSKDLKAFIETDCYTNYIEKLSKEPKDALKILKTKLEIMKQCADDIFVTTTSKHDIIRKTHLSEDKLHPVIRTLMGINCIAPFAKTKRTTLFAYFPFAKNVTLPPENYANYTYNGTYPCVVEFKKINTQRS